MAKKSSPPTNKPSAVRLKPEDKAAVEFIQDQLSAPGMQVNFTDAVRRSIHEFANRLKQDRRKSSGS